MEGSRSEVEGSSDFKAIGKSLPQVLIEDQKLNLCLHSKSMWQPRDSIDVVCVHVLSVVMKPFHGCHEVMSLRGLF